MESKERCTLTDKELYEMAEACIQDLIDTGGGSFTMCIPARPNQDTDLIFTELNQRFMKMCHENAALQAKCNKMEQALNAVIGRNMPVPNKADMINIAREALGLDVGENIANEALSAGEGEKEGKPRQARYGSIPKTIY